MAGTNVINISDVKLCYRVTEIDEDWKEDLGQAIWEAVVGQKTVTEESRRVVCTEWNKIEMRLTNIIGNKIIMKFVDCYQTSPVHLWVPVETWEQELC